MVELSDSKSVVVQLGVIEVIISLEFTFVISGVIVFKFPENKVAVQTLMGFLAACIGFRARLICVHVGLLV